MVGKAGHTPTHEGSNRLDLDRAGWSQRRGTEAGLADAVVAGITVSEAAVFPLTPSGVSEAEQTAR
ncbi:hypothetical protein [Streptomyces sp. NPDC058463]|uniref:hypothetical protein n=1 Tax=Streptomyces sp. NPDC058463 TaxID=3346510 RepID=UPI00365E8231